MKNCLVVYYSHSANTKELAKVIQQITEGAIYEVQPRDAYPTEYNSVVEQAKKEIRSGYRPPLKTVMEHVENYDTIFIGTPNWWSSVAPPIATFLESYDLSGKTIIPFCTHGGGGFGHIENDVKKLCKNSTILPGLAVYGGTGAGSKVESWLKQIGLNL